MKNSEEKQLDQVLKDKLSEGTAHVPGFVWDRIEEELFPKKKRRGFFWWFFGGLCLLTITLLFGIAFSGEEVHSQYVSPIQSTVSGTLDIPFFKENDTQQNEGEPMLNSSKTKGCSQYRDPDSYRDATTKGEIPYSAFTGINQNSKKQVSKFALKKSVKSETNMTAHVLSVNKFTNSLTKSDSNFEKFTDSSSDIKFSSEQALSTKDNDSISQSTTETDSQTSTSNKLSYEAILSLIKRNFSAGLPEPEENKRNSSFSLGIYGGPSLYNSAVFKDYFTSGQLSKRTFASSGFELGLQARFKVGDRFKIYAGLTFNQKQTQFSYNVAITQADYFTYVANGEKVPLENIHDDGANSCFLAKDVTARYQIQSVLISLGTSFEFLRIGRFSAAADLRLSGNIYASLKLKEMQVLNIEQPPSEKFSYLQPGAGLLLNFRLNQRISLGLAPFFSKQFYLKESFSRKMDELVIPLSVSFTF